MADPIQIIRSRQELRKVRGGRDGLYPFLENGTWDIVHWFDDFLGDEIRGSGASPGAYEIVTGTDGDFLILANQENGIGELRATASGNGAGNEYCGLSIPELSFTANRNPVIAVRFNIDTISAVKVEVGFTDVTTDAGAVNTKSSGTSFNADNCAVWILDTTHDGTWDGYGRDNTAAMTVYDPSLSLSGDTTPEAGSFETLIVALREYDTALNIAAAKFIRLDVNGRVTSESDWQTGAVASNVALVPWVFVQERSGTDKGVRIDFIDVRTRRTAL